ncbi:MAG: hypothetical protein H0T46_14665 [Deltaproteobacteria bacterium]|nr:hypothetical protein [Deltaproteobacteria bacterium]
MRARAIVLAVLAVAVLGGGVWLALAVRGGPEPTPAQPAKQQPERIVPTRVAKPAIADAGQQHPTPEAGRAGEIEDYAKASGVPRPIALEERRSVELAERTSDNVLLGELLGAEPTGYMLATIGTQAKVLREAAAHVQSGYRDGKLDDVEALRLLRAAQDTYRAAYLRVTGLTEQQFEKFFAPR